MKKFGELCLIAAISLAIGWLIGTVTLSIVPAPTPQVAPTVVTCVGTNGHYRPANGLNYVVINDERCAP